MPRTEAQRERRKRQKKRAKLRKRIAKGIAGDAQYWTSPRMTARQFLKDTT